MLQHLFANAARVMKLTISSEDGDMQLLEKQIWDLLPLLFPWKTLLPNVVEIVIGAAAMSSTFPWEALLGPKLEDIEILTARVDERFFDALSKAPCLLKLRNFTTYSWFDDMDELVEELRNLEYFEALIPGLGQVHQYVLVTLAQLPRLEIIDLSEGWEGIWPSFPSNFASLRSLTIRQSADVFFIDMFLRDMRYKALTYLQLNLQLAEPYMDNLRDIFVSIGSLSALEHLDFSAWDEGSPPLLMEEWLDECLDLKCSIQPLLNLRRLHTFSLRMPLYIQHEVTNDRVPVFAAAWPNLRLFEYQRLTEDNLTPLTSLPPAGMTLEALPFFALFMPNLEELILQADVRKFKPLYWAPLARSEKEIGLHIARSPIDEESWLFVARYIASVYPNAKLRYEGGQRLSPQELCCWDKVQDYLRACVERT